MIKTWYFSDTSLLYDILICNMNMHRFDVLDEEPGDEDEGGGQR